MATIRLPHDFKEFLRLLIDHKVEYLIIGGYAVGFHGHPRATGDMDIWIANDKTNAEKLLLVLTEFGFNTPLLNLDLLLSPGKIIRMGLPPLRIEILNQISGIEFDDCWPRRIQFEVDDLLVSFIGLEDLKKNKKAAGRHKDLADLESLQE